MPPRTSSRSSRASRSSRPSARTDGGDDDGEAGGVAGGRRRTAIRFVTNARCPFAQKAWIALEASGCEYETTEVSLYGPGGKPGWFLDMNPRGTVPVVVAVDGVVFADSESILDAVGDGVVGVAWGMLRRTDGQSPDGSALADRWRILVSDRLIPVGKSAVLGGRGGSATAELRTLLKDLNAMVAGPYLVGEGLSLADCAAFPFLWRIDREFGIGGVGEENLRSWLDRCMETDPIKRTIPVRGWWWWW